MLGNKGNTTGNRKGEQGVEGTAPTPADNRMAKRRFEKYIALTKDLKPGTYVNEDIIQALPLNGGTKMKCGDTRFYHLQKDHCTNPKVSRLKCGKFIKNGARYTHACNRPLGHDGGCESVASAERRHEREAEYRARKRAEMEERDG